MRLIGTVPTESDATRLGDFLLTVGLPNHVEPNTAGDAWLIWIERDDDVEQGQLRFREYQANPNEPKYAEATAAARAVRQQQQKAAERRRRNYTDVRTSWAGLPRFGTPVTIAIVAICGFIFVLQQTEFAPQIYDWLLFYEPVGFARLALLERTGNVDPDLIMAAATQRATLADQFTMRDAFALVGKGQIWRLVSPTLLHASPWHLLFNIWAFLTIGGMIESRKGLFTMLNLALWGAVLSCCAQAAWDAITPMGGVGFVGLSGVVYSAFGYAWMRGRYTPQERIGLPVQQMSFMLAWLFICMMGCVGAVANMAHAVGLLVGITIGALPLIKRKIGMR